MKWAQPFSPAYFFQGLLRCSSNSEPSEYSSLWRDLLTKYTYLITDTDIKRDIHVLLLDALINRFFLSRLLKEC